MDPLSITATCLGLVSTIAKTSFVITSFVREVRGARSELDSVSRELLSLKQILELLADDASDPTNGTLPEALRKQVAGIVTNCGVVVGEIEKILVEHAGNKLSKATFWALDGKNDMAKLRSSLEAHKSALEIALDMVTLTLARDIKADTQEIRSDTSAIKEDTAQILAEIARLQQQLPQDPSRQNATGFVLERYLDNLTTYAESVCDTSADYDDIETPRMSYEKDESQNAGSSHSLPNQNEIELPRHLNHGLEYTAMNKPKEQAAAMPSLREEDNRGAEQGEGSEYEQPNDQQYNLRKEWRIQIPPNPLVNPLAHTRPDAEGYFGLISPTNDQEPPKERQPPVVPAQTPKNSAGGVKLWRGQFILDLPVLSHLLRHVPHATPPDRDKFTHLRYSALNCSAHQFTSQGFCLRPQLFAKQRQIEIMISVRISGTYPDNHNDSRKEAEALALTLNSVIEFIRALNNFRNHLWTWGPTSWKNVVVVITSTRRVSRTAQDILEKMGLTQTWKELLENIQPGSDLGDYQNFPVTVSHKVVQADLFEYTTQFQPTLKDGFGENMIEVVPSGSSTAEFVSVQMIACMPIEQPLRPPFIPIPISWMSWTRAFAEHLKPRVCIEVDSGIKVNPQQVYKYWETAPSKSGVLPPHMVIYKKNWFSSFYNGLIK